MKTEKKIIIKYKEPDYKTWNNLRAVVGWSPYSFEVYEEVVKNSLCFVTAWYDNQIVGMGRIVGDNVTSFYIQGVVIIPRFQKQGIGTLIVNKLICYAQTKAADGASVWLFAHKGTENFYEKAGFNLHPNRIRGAGMSKKL